MRLLDITAPLTPSDRKQHIAHLFSVPEGVTQLHIVLTWTPKKVAGVTGTNDISLSLFDAHGSRGAGHNRANNEIHLSAQAATPGYVRGAVDAGAWSVVLDTHMIVTPLTYSLTVEVSDAPIGTDAPAWHVGSTAPRGQGWYRGDLHSHTIHSDGSWDVPDLVASARARHLDFATLTDHNTVSPLAQMDSLADDDLLTMGGIELTTYYGHALALGVRQWIDWRVRPPQRTMLEIAAEVRAAGGLFIIAHPMSPGDPICTGCDWQYHEMTPGSARIVEIWNGGTWANSTDYNEQGLALWYSWLNQGLRMVATAGTDVHGPAPLTIAAGFNVVYAEELTEKAVLAAIQQGHLYLSSQPQLTFTGIAADGQTAMMGDVLPMLPAQLTIGWQDAPSGATLRWIVDGSVRETLSTEETGSASLSITDGRWCVVELRAADHTMLAITNPIFFGTWLMPGV